MGRTRSADDLIARAEHQGWRVERMASNHLRFVPPGKGQPMVVIASTPSDHRGRRNELARLKRSGLRL